MTANAPYYHDVDQYGLSAALYTENPSTETPITSLEENHNFVELLEAATTAAAGQVAQPMDTYSGVASTRGKRKRALSSPTHEPAPGETQRGAGPKRTRTEAPTDPQLDRSDDMENGRSQAGSLPPTSESLLNDARAAGVHSAAALFRRTSEKASRKYTRPPMSKLFMSLQLTPENFLHLQAQAKAYMLDPSHPDRQSCVGSRGRSDTDMVKLRLFNCVKDFMSGGAGDRFFGENVEKPGESEAVDAARALGEEKALTEDRLLWPRDGNKIISLVTPLLRRMVTNERQRMYAIETRKGGARKKEGSVEAAPGPGNGGVGQQLGVERLQTMTLPTQLQQLPVAQPQSDDFYQTLSDASLPTRPLAMALTITPKPAKREYKELISSKYIHVPTTKFELPTKPDAEPIINNLNILVAKITPSLSGDGSSAPILLKVYTRLANAPWAPLYQMPWKELCNQVESLLKETMERYPELASLVVESSNQGTTYTADPQTEGAQQGALVERNVPELGPETLRGLAVAATEIQRDDGSEDADNVIAEETSLTDPTIASSAAVRPPAPRTQATSPRSASLPRQSKTTVTSESSDRRPSWPNSNPSSTLRWQHGTPPHDEPRAMEQRPHTPAPVRFPKYKLETQGTLGLRTVSSAEAWANAKREVARATWADKTLNVVVTIL